MDEVITPTATPEAAAPRNRRTAGGREAKRAARSARTGYTVPYITRKIPYYEVLDEEGLQIIERNAEIILEEVGIEFRDDAEALDIWRKAGADIKGERVRFPRGMCQGRDYCRDQDVRPEAPICHYHAQQRSGPGSGVEAYGPFTRDHDSEHLLPVPTG